MSKSRRHRRAFARSVKLTPKNPTPDGPPGVFSAWSWNGGRYQHATRDGRTLLCGAELFVVNDGSPFAEWAWPCCPRCRDLEI